MSALPTPYTVRVRDPRQPTDYDDLGNPVPAWDERDWPIFFYVEGAATVEQLQPNRDLSVLAYTIAGPSQGRPGERSQVRLPGAESDDWHDVNGRPKDYTHGPWVHPTAGVVVELRKAEG